MDFKQVTGGDSRKIFQALSFFGALTLAVSIPWVIFKTFRTFYVKRRFQDLNGKVVVITGASSGLGEALAHEFYKHGCLVILCARRRQELERVRASLFLTQTNVPTQPPVIVPLDLSDLASLPEHINKILAITGQIDILINNGGISQRGRAVHTKLEVDMQIMTVNYFGAVALTKAVLPGMISRNSGHIVFISSVQGLVALPDRSAYSASKHALQAFGDSLRAEIAADNIDVTVVSPGYIKTGISLNALTPSGSAHGEMDQNTATGYSPEYVAELILYATVNKQREIVVSTLLPQLAIVLRKYLPSLYFIIMERRARKKPLKGQT